MKQLILLLASLSIGWAADGQPGGPKVTFAKSFPGSAPAFFSISVERSGAASYNESEDPDNAEDLTLERSLAAQIFDLSERMKRFQTPLESGLKVANMGMKTFRWEDGAEKHEVKYNYSVLDDAKALSDIFERIGESARMLLDLKRAMKHDRLGVVQATDRISAAWENKRLVATAQFLPVLEKVAQNEAYIHMAREKAARVVDAIRATGQ